MGTCISVILCICMRIPGHLTLQRGQTLKLSLAVVTVPYAGGSGTCCSSSHFHSFGLGSRNQSCHPRSQPGLLPARGTSWSPKQVSSACLCMHPSSQHLGSSRCSTCLPHAIPVQRETGISLLPTLCSVSLPLALLTSCFPDTAKPAAGESRNPNDPIPVPGSSPTSQEEETKPHMRKSMVKHQIRQDG